MGTVPVEIVTVGRDRGYPIEQLTVYVYCDACGSFNIRDRMSGKMGNRIAIAVLCAIGLWLLVKDAAEPGIAFICWPFFFLFLVGIVWQYNYYLAHVCKDCGNMEISETNSLGYPEYDLDALPVSEQQAHRHYFTR